MLTRRGTSENVIINMDNQYCVKDCYSLWPVMQCQIKMSKVNVRSSSLHGKLGHKMACNSISRT